MTSSIGSSWSAWFCVSQPRKLLDVVAGLGLRLRGDGQDVLRADRGDEVGLHLDLVRLGDTPRTASSSRRCPRAPSDPRRPRHLAGGAAGADMHQRQRGRSRTHFQRRTRERLSCCSLTRIPLERGLMPPCTIKGKGNGGVKPRAGQRRLPLQANRPCRESCPQLTSWRSPDQLPFA